MNTQLVIIEGVAGGATAAARARRVDEEADITLIERGPHVYANCGLPYFIARDIEKRSTLLLQTPEGFLERYRIKVLLDTAQRLIVRVADEYRRSDAEIAAAVLRALTWNLFVPRTVIAKIEHGAVTLAGDVHWAFQRSAAALSVRFLRGVVVVNDHITVASKREREAHGDGPSSSER